MSSFDKYGISRIGALLRDLRKEKGITQEELAEKMMEEMAKAEGIAEEIVFDSVVYTI